MQTSDIIVRPMMLSDIDDAMKLSMEEGWNQTQKDWRLFLEYPGNTGRVAEYKNKIVGTTTAINYSNQVAWISMVLVDKAYRGHGISKSLLASVFKNLECCESIKLDATSAGQQVYKTFDFKDEYRITRMTNLSMALLPTGDTDIITEPVQLKDIPDIIALDEISFGANRKQLIEYLAREYQGKATMIKQNTRVIAFAMGRKGSRYHHIGPVMASKFGDAKILISGALQKLAGQPVVADVLCDKEEMIAWLSSIGFIQQRQFIRMYKGENTRAGAVTNQYLIAGPEFG